MNADRNPRAASTAAFREEVWDAGWRPVALFSFDAAHRWLKPNERGKRPKGDGWQERARRPVPEAATTAPELDALETGILADGLRVLDFDIDNSPAVATLRALAVRHFGENPVRWRENSPRILMPYRAAAGSPVKIVRAGTVGKIEVLGHGQQFAAAERHQSGVTLRWTESLAAVPVESIPALTEPALMAFLAEAAPVIGCKAEAPPQSPSYGSPSPYGATAELRDVVAALEVIPPDHALDWEHWNRVGLAAWAATGGSPEGRAAFAAWTARIEAPHERKPDERWAHYTRHGDRPAGVGAGTLFFLAEVARPGWRKPSLATSEAAAPVQPQRGFLDRTRRPAPPLPLQVFGKWWEGWITSAAAGVNSAADYVALPLLVAASALIGNARWARGWPGWDEPPILWAASVGHPSSGKSPGAAPVMRDVLGIVETGMSRTYPETLAEWEEAKAVADTIEKQWVAELHQRG